MAEAMNNIDIRDFLVVSSVEDGDYIVLSLSSGTSAKVKAALFRSSFLAGATPVIKNGVWWIGSEDTGVQAEGKTPQLRRGSLGVEYKYANEGEEAWRLLVPFEDIDLDFDRLTEEQRAMIKLNFSDLTEEEIAELQQPANDMIEVLEKTNENVQSAEDARVAAENKRISAETERKDSENARLSAEAIRNTSEEQRKKNEQERITTEQARVTSENSRAASEEERESNENTRVSQEESRINAESARVLEEEARVAAESNRVNEFDRLKAESESATASAQDTADHPTYIGEDNYVYKWNKITQTYNKTSVYVRGEAFSIKKVYSSIDEMYSDVMTDFKEGDFCLINTGDVENPENAQLFVRSAAGSWDFLVDMSGAIGFTGKTPQLFIGTVSVGSGKDSAEVAVSSNGTDEDGNPKYNINYVVPCLAYEDLTAEQIAELQQPANEMIVKLQETDKFIQEAEEARMTAEESRAQAENNRVSNETMRMESEDVRIMSESKRISAEEERANAESERISSEKKRKEAELLRESQESSRNSEELIRIVNESNRETQEQKRMDIESERVQAEQGRADAEEVRVNAENARVTSEESRIQNESARISEETVRKDNEEIRQTNEKTRQETDQTRKDDYLVIRKDAEEATNDAILAAEQARNTPIIQNGTWWLYDIEKEEYVDTGQSVNSDYKLTKEKIESVFVGDIETHTHTHLVYCAQKYEEVPDFSTLTEWMDDKGELHAFVPGNDIYVIDGNEPTGYANYKLAYTSSGNEWVKISQVPEGFKMILVKDE